MKNAILFLFQWSAIAVAAAVVSILGAAVYVICYVFLGRSDSSPIGPLTERRKGWEANR